MFKVGCAIIVTLMTAGVASAQSQAQIDVGQTVFTDQKCAICHSIDGEGNSKGPMDGVGSKLSADEIREWIVDAPAMTATTGADRKPEMKAFTSLTDEDLDALVAYLQSLKE